ncbi:MAG: hypothetical protein AB8I08_35565 [Sandaracinaceae bacterium]
MDRTRLAHLESHSPELARLVVELRRASEQRAEAGDLAEAARLAHLSDVSLLGALELVARSEAAEREVVVLREVAARPTPVAIEPAPEPEPPAARRRPLARQPRPTTAEPAAQEPAPVPEDPSAAVRAQLASLADRLSRLESTPTNRVGFDSVQNSLIEADRALAEGSFDRASQLAIAAERQLAGLTGEAPPHAVAAPERGLLVDARRELGERAIVRGRLVAVQLDPLVRFRDGAWQPRRAGPLTPLRALARRYRDAVLLLVTVGEPSDASFANQREALSTFLHQRFQVPAQRIVWRAQVGASLPQGTYLVLRAQANE